MNVLFVYPALLLLFDLQGAQRGYKDTPVRLRREEDEDRIKSPRLLPGCL